MCDCYTPQGEAIPTNKRHNAANIFSHPDVAAEEPWYNYIYFFYLYTIPETKVSVTIFPFKFNFDLLGISYLKSFLFWEIGMELSKSTLSFKRMSTGLLAGLLVAFLVPR
jgi:hypothetical protein